MAIGFLEDVELLDAAIDIVADVVPGIGGVMLLKICISVGEISEAFVRIISGTI